MQVLDFEHWNVAGIRHGNWVNPPAWCIPHPVRRQGAI
jgi:hypothetical protein